MTGRVRRAKSAPSDAHGARDGSVRSGRTWVDALLAAMRLVLHRGRASDGPASASPLLIGYSAPSTRNNSPAQPAASASRQTAPPPARATSETTRMLDELDGLLGLHPHTRGVMRQLAFVEKALRRSGVRILDDLPAHVLLRAHEQLDALTMGRWSPGIARFGAQLTASLALRTRSGLTSVAPAPHSAGQGGSLLEVGSNGHPLFAPFAPLSAGPRPTHQESVPVLPTMSLHADFEPTLPMHDVAAGAKD